MAPIVENTGSIPSPFRKARMSAHNSGAKRILNAVPSVQPSTPDIDEKVWKAFSASLTASCLKTIGVQCNTPTTADPFRLVSSSQLPSTDLAAIIVALYHTGRCLA